LATSRFQGAKELLETEFPEEECRNEDLPPTFLCHAAGMLRRIGKIVVWTQKAFEQRPFSVFHDRPFSDYMNIDTINI